MTTTAPDRPLDLREFQDIVDEARRLIPRYTPEWTDHNVSDPGITLIELFAWMTEMTIYQLNRVPDHMYERFLELIGVRRHPPVPAAVDVTCYLSAPLPRPITVPAETEVATDRTEAGEALVFSTVEPLTISPPDLVALRAWRQGRGFEDYMPYVSGGRVEAPIFNEQPQEGDAFYIGHAGDLAGVSLQLRLDCGGGEATHIDPRDPPLVWEYWSNDRDDWAPLRLLDDTGTGRERDPDVVDPTFASTAPATSTSTSPSTPCPATSTASRRTGCASATSAARARGMTARPPSPPSALRSWPRRFAPATLTPSTARCSARATANLSSASSSATRPYSSATNRTSSTCSAATRASRGPRCPTSRAPARTTATSSSTTAPARCASVPSSVRATAPGASTAPSRASATR